MSDPHASHIFPTTFNAPLSIAVSMELGYLVLKMNVGLLFVKE